MTAPIDLTPIPESAGHVVGVCIHQDRVIIACEFAVYRVLDDDVLEVILQVPTPKESDHDDTG